ncbi:MAG: hypothetical protein QF791_04235, partial [Nitrospinaceae bacterium]|nr:hypothetical protein [Nitrospinaceae bacterium]
QKTRLGIALIKLLGKDHLSSNCPGRSILSINSGQNERLCLNFYANIYPLANKPNAIHGLDFYEKMVFAFLDWTRSTGNRREAKRRPV